MFLCYVFIVPVNLSGLMRGGKYRHAFPGSFRLPLCPALKTAAHPCTSFSGHRAYCSSKVSFWSPSGINTQSPSTLQNGHGSHSFGLSMFSISTIFFSFVVSKCRVWRSIPIVILSCIFLCYRTETYRIPAVYYHRAIVAMDTTCFVSAAEYIADNRLLTVQLHPVPLPGDSMRLSLPYRIGCKAAYQMTRSHHSRDDSCSKTS